MSGVAPLDAFVFSKRPENKKLSVSTKFTPEQEAANKAEFEKKTREIQEAEAARVTAAQQASSITSGANAWGINEEAYKAGYGRNKGRASTIIAGSQPMSAGGLAKQELFGS